MVRVGAAGSPSEAHVPVDRRWCAGGPSSTRGICAGAAEAAACGGLSLTHMRRAFDRAAASAAERIIGWIAERVDPSHRRWIEAMGAELHAIDGGWRKLVWVSGALRLAWSLSWRREMVYGQKGLPAVGSTCAFGVVLGVIFWFLFTHPDRLPTMRGFEAGLAVYLFLAGFLAGPATKSFAAGALIGLTSGLLGVFSGFVMSPVDVLGPFVYQATAVAGAVCGGLGAVARAYLHGVRSASIAR